MKTPYHFFLSQAGYSYDPKTETPMQGRIRCAQLLAAAEKTAKEQNVSFRWEVGDMDSSEFSDETPAWQLWSVVAYKEDGTVFASLGGVDFGRDGEPWGQPYKRVVEAELACELDRS